MEHTKCSIEFDCNSIQHMYNHKCSIQNIPGFVTVIYGLETIRCHVGTCKPVVSIGDGGFLYQ